MKKITIPIYNDTVYVDTYIEQKEVKDKYDYDASPTNEAFCFRSEKGVVVVFNKNKITSQVIVHECVHIVNFIFAKKGIDLDIHNDEPQAYLMDYIFGKINKLLTFK